MSVSERESGRLCVFEREGERECVFACVCVCVCVNMRGPQYMLSRFKWGVEPFLSVTPFQRLDIPVFVPASGVQALDLPQSASLLRPVSSWHGGCAVRIRQVS